MPRDPIPFTKRIEPSRAEPAVKDHWKVLKQTATEFIDDGALRQSAALSYYAAFSLAPLLLIAISVAGWFFGDEAVRGQVDDYLQGSLGNVGAGALQDMIAHARKPEKNLLASIAGLVMLLFGAGGVFGQLQEALNTVWGVRRRSGRGFKGLVKDRFLSFAMVLGTGFLLLTSMILSAVLQGLSTWVGSILSLPTQVWAAISAVLSFGVVTVLFAAIFKVLPDARIAWKHVWGGAVFTAALFSIGKFIIGWYLGREATNSAYGATGALALVLLWVYYSSLILLFGAEFTQVSANSRGAPILPDEDAEAVPDAAAAAGKEKDKAVKAEPETEAAIEGLHPAPVATVRSVEAGPRTAVAGKKSTVLVLCRTVLPAVAGWIAAPAVKKGLHRLTRRVK